MSEDLSAIPVLPFDLAHPALGALTTQALLPGASSYLNVTVTSIPGWRPLKADVHVPHDGEGPFPVVVYVHGGALVGGVKEMGCWASLPAAGLAVVSLDYRLMGEVSYPGPVEDVQAAVRWVRTNGADLGLDPGRVAVWGSSAGGYLAGRMAFADGRPLGSGREPGDGVSHEVDAVVLHYPVTDFSALLHQVGSRGHAAVEATIRHFFDLGEHPAPQPSDDSSVLRAARAALRPPPLHIAHGDADLTVPIEQSVALHETLRARGVHSELVVVPGATHAAPVFAEEEVVRSGLRFLQRTWSE